MFGFERGALREDPPRVQAPRGRAPEEAQERPQPRGRRGRCRAQEPPRACEPGLSEPDHPEPGALRSGRCRGGGRSGGGIRGGSAGAIVRCKEIVLADQRGSSAVFQMVTIP